ncbi:MAG TPA: hypothetical protein VLY20_10940 [Nitrospiria bacterium]|nr:hypothetical protein [Nitrospiria bacterium]
MNELGRLGYERNVSLFQNTKSKIRPGSRHKVDFYNSKTRIAIEVEKTKTTTILLDIVKFIIGHKRRKNGKPLVDFGVLILPDKYRSKKYPEGQGDKPFNRACNDLAFINTILFVNDILVIEYKTNAGRAG